MKGGGPELVFLVATATAMVVVAPQRSFVDDPARFLHQDLRL
jgi:hypothetical protein